MEWPTDTRRATLSRHQRHFYALVALKMFRCKQCPSSDLIATADSVESINRDAYLIIRLNSEEAPAEEAPAKPKRARKTKNEEAA